MEATWFDRNKIHRSFTKSSPIAEAYLERLLYPIQQRIMQIGFIPWFREVSPNQQNVSDEELQETTGPDLITSYALMLTADAIKLNNITIVLPWDIYHAVMEAGENFINLFNFQQYRGVTDIALPVTITINGNSFIHNLTREQFLGMALAAYENNNVQLSMFNTNFDVNGYFNDSNSVDYRLPSIFTTGNKLTYTTDYTGKDGTYKITFNSPLFLQGYLSICEWTQQTNCINRFSDVKQGEIPVTIEI